MDSRDKIIESLRELIAIQSALL